MSVSLQTQPTSFAKGTYFKSGRRLYYLLDIMPKDCLYLVEDCLTNDVKFWSNQEFKRIRKEVIRLGNSD